MGSSPITEDEFRLIKKKIEESGPDFDAWAIGYSVGRGNAKISIIASCKTYEDYKRISKAEHPPVKNSLADRVSELERWRRKEVDPYLEHEQRKKTEEAFKSN